MPVDDVKIVLLEKHIGHHQTVIERERSQTPKPKRSHSRGRSQSKGRPNDGHKSVHDDTSNHKKKGKNNKKRDQKPFIEEAPNSIYGMLPCSSFFPAVMEKIATSYGEYYDMHADIKGLTAYSYEAYSEDRPPHAFYVSIEEHKKINKTYSAYEYAVNPLMSACIS